MYFQRLFSFLFFCIFFQAKPLAVDHLRRFLPYIPVVPYFLGHSGEGLLVPRITKDELRKISLFQSLEHLPGQSQREKGRHGIADLQPLHTVSAIKAVIVGKALKPCSFPDG